MAFKKEHWRQRLQYGSPYGPFIAQCTINHFKTNWDTCADDSTASKDINLNLNRVVCAHLMGFACDVSFYIHTVSIEVCCYLTKMGDLLWYSISVGIGTLSIGEHHTTSKKCAAVHCPPARRQPCVFSLLPSILTHIIAFS